VGNGCVYFLLLVFKDRTEYIHVQGSTSAHLADAFACADADA